MITITKEVLDIIVKHGLSELPNEACGYLAGTNGLVNHSYQLTNIDHSPEHFSFDPSEQFQTLKDSRKKGMEIIANYHSHPETPARPSEEDIRLAYDPEISYVIISFATKKPDIRAFRIKNDVVEKEEIRYQ